MSSATIRPLRQIRVTVRATDSPTLARPIAAVTAWVADRCRSGRA
jgi:hypothetical protein